MFLNQHECKQLHTLGLRPMYYPAPRERGGSEVFAKENNGGMENKDEMGTGKEKGREEGESEIDETRDGIAMKCMN